MQTKVKGVSKIYQLNKNQLRIKGMIKVFKMIVPKNVVKKSHNLTQVILFLWNHRVFNMKRNKSFKSNPQFQIKRATKH